MTSLKKEQLKKDATIKDLKNENQKLKLEAKNNLKVGKIASEKLNVMVSTVEKENLCLKSTVNYAEKELQVVNMKLKTLKDRKRK